MEPILEACIVSLLAFGLFEIVWARLNMKKNKAVKDYIKTLLDENGPMNSNDILVAVNDKFSHGVTMQQVANYLGKNFKRVDEETVGSIVEGSTYQIAVWDNYEVITVTKAQFLNEYQGSNDVRHVRFGSDGMIQIKL